MKKVSVVVLSIFLIGGILSIASIAQAKKLVKLTWVFPGTSDPERVYADTLARDFNTKYASEINIEVSYIPWLNLTE